MIREIFFRADFIRSLWQTIHLWSNVLLGIIKTMVTIRTYKKLTWIDLESPTKEEVRTIMEKYYVHPLVVNELLSPTLRPKVDVYENLLYIILHFPTITHRHDDRLEHELDFIVGKDFLITTHYGPFEALADFSKIFEVNSILNKGNMADHAGFLFFYLIRELYGNMTDELDHTRHTLNSITEEIFAGKEEKMVQAISGVGRNLLAFKQAIQPHKEVLDSFEEAGVKFFGKEFLYYLNAMSGEYYKIYNRLESQREMLSELRDTNDSLLTTKTNETMKILTILASLLLPAAIIASIFGMNTVAIPIIGMENDFYIVMGMMGALTIGLFLYFKYQKWI